MWYTVFRIFVKRLQALVKLGSRWPRTVFIILSPCKMLQGFLLAFVMVFVQWFVPIGLAEMFWFVATLGRKSTKQNPHIEDSCSVFFLYIIIIILYYILNY